MKQKYNKNSNILETIVIGLFKGIWSIIKLPFKKGKRAKGINNIDKNYILKKRSEVSMMLKTDNIHELRSALIEADKLVDFILEKKGYKGKSFADRLRDAEKLTDPEIYQEVWRGHKVRNRVAHENGNISKEVIIEAAKKLLKYSNL